MNSGEQKWAQEGIQVNTNRTIVNASECKLWVQHEWTQVNTSGICCNSFLLNFLIYNKIMSRFSVISVVSLWRSWWWPDSSFHVMKALMTLPMLIIYIFSPYFGDSFLYQSNFLSISPVLFIYAFQLNIKRAY